VSCLDGQSGTDRTLASVTNQLEAAHVVCQGRVINSVMLSPIRAGQGTFAPGVPGVFASDLVTEVAVQQLKAIVDMLVRRGLP
jgi:hypothetical protein